MDIGSILLIFALLILVALFISRPFFERQLPLSARSTQEDHDLSHLLAERDRLLNALQELDFDYALAKIPEEDYPAQRALLLQRGAEVLRSLDAIQPDQSTGSAEARIEAAIAARRAANVGSTTPERVRAAALVAGQDDELEAVLASRRRERREKSAGFCPQCGSSVQQSDHFCPKCGAKVA